jgi:hypothetical protein
MPDVWTKHPDIVRDLLKEAGFTCGVEGRFLKGRNPEWTCIYDGKSMRGDLYVHHVDTLQRQSGVPAPDVATAAMVAGAEWMGPLLAGLILGLLAGRLKPPRHRPRKPDFS